MPLRSPLFEIALGLVRLGHGACVIVTANYGITSLLRWLMRRAQLLVEKCWLQIHEIAFALLEHLPPRWRGSERSNSLVRKIEFQTSSEAREIRRVREIRT